MVGRVHESAPFVISEVVEPDMLLVAYALVGIDVALIPLLIRVPAGQGGGVIRDAGRAGRVVLDLHRGVVVLGSLNRLPQVVDSRRLVGAPLWIMEQLLVSVSATVEWLIF